MPNKHFRFTFTGTGTSQGIPVIGCDCEVCRSTDSIDKRLRTSGLLQSENTSLVFDTGPDFRQQMLRLDQKVLDAVVFTHPHKDHTAGMDDVRSYNYRLQRNMPIYANAATITHLHKEYYYIFEHADYPGVPKLDLYEIDEKAFQVGDISLLPIPVLHGSMEVYGFRCGSFAYITDANFISSSSLKKLTGVKILVLNALRLEKHHSHFTLSEAIDMVERIGVERAYFTHISHLLGKHQTISTQLPPHISLAYDGFVLEWTDS
ncbi:MAG: MBL fold metallo-hydrolase [Bacteroidota bacterium]